MKKLALALALTGAATTGAMAGSLGKTGPAMTDPVIEPPVIVEETRKSTAGVIIPVVLLVLVAAAIAANN